MKICHITFGFPPVCGGTETHNYSLVKYLSDNGHDVDVIVVRSKINLYREIGYSEKLINDLKKEEYKLPELKNVRIFNLQYPRPLIGYYKIWKKIKLICKNY